MIRFIFSIAQIYDKIKFMQTILWTTVQENEKLVS